MSDPSANPAPIEPRLAAVVFTDVVGYSARMQRDESGTLGLVRADFERMHTLCTQHGGEVLNTMGDGLLLCFQSAAKAVACALQIQSEFGKRRNDLPSGQMLEHRIGIHLGDVHRLESGGVAGDGVNIAARLEAKAPPGGICLSQTVYDTVRNRLAMRATFVGSEALKNIADPIRIWHIAPAATAHEDRAFQSPDHDLPAIARSASPDLTSIAVLPFTNMSDDKDTGYFADGVQEDLLTQLSCAGNLKVVSRTSVMEYRDTRKKVEQIASELGVRTLVEGSVRRAGNRVRVTAQLIDARSDKHLWARNYDRELNDIFAIQSELATEIANALQGNLAQKPSARLGRQSTSNLEAYDLYLRSRELGNMAVGTSKRRSLIAEEIALLTRAVQIDPSFARAWSQLAVCHGLAVAFRVDGSNSRRELAHQCAARGVELAPDDIQVRFSEGIVRNLAANDYRGARTVLERILEQAPYNTDILLGLADTCQGQGRYGEAVQYGERALAIDARNERALSGTSRGLLAFRRYDAALRLQDLLVSTRPDLIERRGNWYWIEYLKTGSWASYDTWRLELGRGTAEIPPWLWAHEFARASYDRSWERLLSLLDSASDEVRDYYGAYYLTSERAQVLWSAGELERARNVAKGLLQDIAATLLAKTSLREYKTINLVLTSALMNALVGDRDAALRDLNRAFSAAWSLNDVNFARRIDQHLVYLYALLDERDLVARELTRQLAMPFAWINGFRVDLELSRLWDAPEIQALCDPEANNNAPLPLSCEYSFVVTH